MRLLLVRHAVAVAREEFPGPEAERPLTAEGEKKFARAAQGLVILVPAVDALVASPLRRARETAAILAAAFGPAVPEVVECDALLPGAEPAELARWLRRKRLSGTVVLAGHEPQLGRFASWLLAGSDRSFVQLKKGAACLLELPPPPKPGAATLAWSLAGSQLRRLSG